MKNLIIKLVMILLLCVVSCSYETNNITECGEQETGIKITYRVLGKLGECNHALYLNDRQEKVGCMFLDNWKYIGYFDKGDSVMLQVTVAEVDTFDVQILKNDVIWKTTPGHSDITLFLGGRL